MKDLNDFLYFLIRRYKIYGDDTPKAAYKQMKLWVTLEAMHKADVLAPMTNKTAYLIYKVFCEKYEYEPVSLIHFSRFLCKYFPYCIVDKKIKIPQHGWEKVRMITKLINHEPNIEPNMNH